MKGRKKWLITFFLILIFLSCGKKENKGNNGENGSNIGQTEDQMVTFKDKSIERIISDFEINSKKNKIDIDKFENLKSMVFLKFDYFINYKNYNKINISYF